MKSIDWKVLRKEIPACEKYTYLNTAGQGPVSKRAAQGGRLYYEESLEYGNMLWDQWSEKIVNIRKKTATFIGCHSDEIAFLPNSSLGMNYIAKILDNAGDVLMHTDEFPSCSLPWLQQGYHVKFVAAEHNGKVSIDDFLSAITPTTKIIVVSHVQYATGFCQNLETLGAICKNKGIHLVVDACQSAGALDIDVKRFNIEFLVFSGYKWLNAGYGIAVLFISKAFHDSSCFPAVGWRSAKEPSQLINHRLELANNVAALELGHPLFPSIFALGGAIEVLSDIGVNTITKRIHDLTDYLHSQLMHHNIEIISPLEKEDRSGITLFVVPNISSMIERLMENNVLVAKRGDGIRVALHYYNNHDDIDKFIDVIK